MIYHLIWLYFIIQYIKQINIFVILSKEFVKIILHVLLTLLLIMIILIALIFHLILFNNLGQMQSNLLLLFINLLFHNLKNS